MADDRIAGLTFATCGRRWGRGRAIAPPRLLADPRTMVTRRAPPDPPPDSRSRAASQDRDHARSSRRWTRPNVLVGGVRPAHKLNSPPPTVGGLAPRRSAHHTAQLPLCHDSRFELRAAVRPSGAADDLIARRRRAPEADLGSLQARLAGRSWREAVLEPASAAIRGGRASPIRRPSFVYVFGTCRVPARGRADRPGAPRSTARRRRTRGARSRPSRTRRRGCAPPPRRRRGRGGHASQTAVSARTKGRAVVWWLDVLPCPARAWAVTGRCADQWAGERVEIGIAANATWRYDQERRSAATTGNPR
jgi:hypothetical protein